MLRVAIDGASLRVWRCKVSWTKKKIILTRHFAVSEWQEDLIEVLVNAGTTGLKQSEIVSYFARKASSESLVRELEILHAQQRVQKFMVKKPSGAGRPAVVWRATIHILKEPKAV
jgi:hypothetical protein